MSQFGWVSIFGIWYNLCQYNERLCYYKHIISSKYTMKCWGHNWNRFGKIWFLTQENILMISRSQSVRKITFHSRELKKFGKIQFYLITAPFKKFALFLIDAPSLYLIDTPSLYLITPPCNSKLNLTFSRNFLWY